MAGKLSHSAVFFREYLRHFHHTGAVLPSGRQLAKALTRFVDNRPLGKGDMSDLPERPGGGHRREALVVAQIGPVPFSRPRRILEVGPGTGAVTRRIISRMGAEDRLDMVELNETFVRLLEDRFRNDREFQPVAGRARVLHCPVENLAGDDRYDVIVSGLPLNNFTGQEVEGILASLVARLTPGGTLSFFEYIAMRPARAMFVGRTDRARLREVGRAMQAAFNRHEIRREAVLLNVPPAWVHHLQAAQ
jgi:phosphatidylethanolamine/phosphatidyl-N-methylethanolamine N-methyltransferase